ncbi:hypothetical protein LPYR103PRE_24880 [Segatella asaccharophila]
MRCFSSKLPLSEFTGDSLLHNSLSNLLNNLIMGAAGNKKPKKAKKGKHTPAYETTDSMDTTSTTSGKGKKKKLH